MASCRSQVTLEASGVLHSLTALPHMSPLVPRVFLLPVLTVLIPLSKPSLGAAHSPGLSHTAVRRGKELTSGSSRFRESADESHSVW